MRNAAAQFSPDLTPLDAFTASMRVWLVDLLVWLTSAIDGLKSPTLKAFAKGALKAFAPQIRVELRQTATELRGILFVQAVARLGLRPSAQRAAYPCAAPAGFRLSRAQGRVSQIVGATLGDLNAGTLRERAERLQHILENPEPHIARLVARLRRIICRAPRFTLVLTESVREAITSAALPSTQAALDTS